MENFDFDLRSIQEARDLARKGEIAAKKMATYSQEQIEVILQNMVRAAEEHAVCLGKMAAEETGFGKAEDKAYKNHAASTLLYEEIKDMKTVGIIDEDPVKHTMDVAAPVGLVMGIVPSTNPTSTTIFKSIIAVKSGNAIVMKSSRNGHINENTAISADQSAVASAAGVNGAVIRAGYDVLGVAGQIQSLAGADITPQTYAQTIAAAGKYGAANHTIRGVPLPPANVIKKGYRYWIGSNYVDGTFEGYVPMPTDLYVRGNNIVGFSKYEGHDLPNFDSGQLTFVTNYGGMQAPFDFTRYTRVNFEIHKTAKQANSYISIRDLNNKVVYAKVVLDNTLNVTQTVSIALNTMAINSFFGFEFASWRGAVYRIWAS